MRYLLPLIGAAGLVLIVGTVYRRWRRDQFSDGWWLDQQRREGRASYDGVRIAFPIDKVRNDAAWLQTQKLRKRA